MAEVSQSPILKVTDCWAFAGKETEQHYSWCLWCWETEGKKEREMVRRGVEVRGGGSCQSVSIFTRQSHWLSHSSPLHYPSIPHKKSPFVSKATTSQVSLTTPPPPQKKTTHNCHSSMHHLQLPGAVMIMVSQQHWGWRRWGKGEVNYMDRGGVNERS